MQSSGLVCGDPAHDHLIRERSEHPGLTGYLIDLITGGNRGIFQIKFAVIIREIFVAREKETQVAHCLVRHPVRRFANEMLIDQRLCFTEFIVEDQFSDQRQGISGFRIVIAVRLPGPDRIFIQLPCFAARIAIHHSPQTTVPDRQCFHPLRCRFVIPQFQIRSLLSVCPGMGDENKKGG